MVKSPDTMPQYDTLVRAWSMLAEGRGAARAMSMIGLSAQSAMAAEAVRLYEVESTRKLSAEQKESLAAAAMLAARLTQLADKLPDGEQEATAATELAAYLMRVTSQTDREMIAMPSGYSETLEQLAEDTLAKTSVKLVR